MSNKVKLVQRKSNGFVRWTHVILSHIGKVYVYIDTHTCNNKVEYVQILFSEAMRVCIYIYIYIYIYILGIHRYFVVGLSSLIVRYYHFMLLIKIITMQK